MGPLVAAMQQIADWLKKIGMSEYAERLVDNRIDVSVLPDLTDQHLRDLGVALGDRLRLLCAVRELGGPMSTTPSPGVATAALALDGAEFATAM
jgi:hypothetical protein